MEDSFWYNEDQNVKRKERLNVDCSKLLDLIENCDLSGTDVLCDEVRDL